MTNTAYLKELTCPIVINDEYNRSVHQQKLHANQAERVKELYDAFDELLGEYRKEVKLYSGQDTEFTVRMHNARVPK